MAPRRRSEMACLLVAAAVTWGCGSGEDVPVGGTGPTSVVVATTTSTPFVSTTARVTTTRRATTTLRVTTTEPSD